MVNKDFAFAYHLLDIHCLVAVNVTALCAGWYSIVVVVVVVLKIIANRKRNCCEGGKYWTL